MSADHRTGPVGTTRLTLTVEKPTVTYVQVPFDVPEYATRFDLRYTYPSSEACIIDLGPGAPNLTDLLSDTGLVGWSGGARREVFVAVDAATPGYRLDSADARGVLNLTYVTGFVRGQNVVDASRSAIVHAGQALVAAGKGGRLDWSSAEDRPVLRALTSPINLI